MNREEAEAALQAWATVQRDDLVRAAHEAGVSKNRIHALTGLARTTVDRILEAPVGTTPKDLATYLVTFAQAWPRQTQAWGYNFNYPPATIASQHSTNDVAKWLLADAEFRALKLGNWLSTPDGEFFEEAVTMLAPPPYGDDARLLMEALKLAAEQQQVEARRKILAAIAIGSVAAIAIGSTGK